MGSVCDAYDNALAESLFASLECEVLDRNHFGTRQEARTAVFSWIEGWSTLTVVTRPWVISRQSNLSRSSAWTSSPQAQNF